VGGGQKMEVRKHLYFRSSKQPSKMNFNGCIVFRCELFIDHVLGARHYLIYNPYEPYCAYKKTETKSNPSRAWNDLTLKLKLCSIPKVFNQASH
jgi:hypothetical protein